MTSLQLHRNVPHEGDLGDFCVLNDIGVFSMTLILKLCLATSKCCTQITFKTVFRKKGRDVLVFFFCLANPVQ